MPPIRIIEPDDTLSHSKSSSTNEPLPILAIVNAILRNRLRIAAIVAILCGGAIAYSFLSSRQWISQASFSIQGTESSKLSGLAAQFGFSLNMSARDAAQSPEYYVQLLTSRPILDSAVNSRYTFNRDGRSVTGTLADVYEIKDKSPAIRTYEAARALKKSIKAARDRETGIVTLEVSAKSPELAQSVVSRLLELVNDFNRITRQSRASNEKRFLEGRLADEGAALRAAEDRFKTFLERNRGSIGSIPELALERDRLSRDISRRQEVFTSLSQNYEQARLDEVRDAPALTLIESPSLPVRPAPRGTIRRTFVALVLGLLIAILPLVLRVMLSARARSIEEEVAEFRKLRGEIRLWGKRSSDVTVTAKEA